MEIPPRAGRQRSYIPGVGAIRITAVEPVDIDTLTDAIQDGFPSAIALQHELRTIYGNKLAAGHKAFRIAFECTVEVQNPKVKSGESRIKSQKLHSNGK